MQKSPRPRVLTAITKEKKQAIFVRVNLVKPLRVEHNIAINVSLMDYLKKKRLT